MPAARSVLIRAADDGLWRAETGNKERRNSMKMETMVPTTEKVQIEEIQETLCTMQANEKQTMLAYLQGIQMGQQLAVQQNKAV